MPVNLSLNHLIQHLICQERQKKITGTRAQLGDIIKSILSQSLHIEQVRLAEFTAASTAADK